MRIIYLHQYFNTPDMSGGTRSYEIGRRLVDAGHQVEMVTSWREHSEKSDWFITEEAGMRVHWIPVPYSNHMSYRQRIGAFIKFATGAARKASNLDGDVILATSTPLTIALPGVYAARRQNIPMVFEVRDLWPELPIAIGALKNPVIRWVARKLETFAYMNSRQLIALSPGMKEGIERGGYPADQITVVPNSSDLDLFQRNEDRGLAFRKQHGINENKIVVGYTGTFGKINGVGYLARLAAALKDDARFIFLAMGDGQERLQVTALAKELDVLGVNFMMLPKVTKTEMTAVLSAVDVATSLFVPLPEMEVNSANKFFDALAAGCCVAINYGGWQAELLMESGAGFRLDRDSALAARELQKYADDPDRIKIAGLQARKLAEKKFSRDQLAKQVERVLLDAVKGKLSC